MWRSSAQTGKQERVTTKRCFKHYRVCVFVLKSRVNARKEPLTVSLFRAKGEDLNSNRTLAEKNELAQITAARDPAYSGLFNQAFFSRLFPRPRQNSYIRRCVFYSEVHLSTSSPIVCRSHDAANLWNLIAPFCSSLFTLILHTRCSLKYERRV